MLPSDRYRELIDARALTPDAAQAAVVGRLDRLHAQLAGRRKAARWRRLVPFLRPRSIDGLYLWGGVGRGKTMLMDLFFECLPEDRRMRAHFHRFMYMVHERLADLVGTPDPLQAIADEVAARADVLCFDEFFVTDIGDAMLLGELLTGLVERGVTFVATSNVPPSGLYENGLQRRRFLPAIELLERHCEVYHLDAEVDYRLRVLERAEIYHAPLDAAAEQSLLESFAALAMGVTPEPSTLCIHGREIPVRAVAEDVAWFDFSALCEGPRSQNDYIEIARVYHAVLVSDLPIFTADNEDAARRFVSLVDEFYDRAVKLIVSAAAPPTELYRGQRLTFEFTRTASRLIEMQAHDYLARTHKA